MSDRRPRELGGDTSLQEELRRRNRELEALHRATLDISGELSLDLILERVVARARRLVGAEYGAIAVVERPHRIIQFVTSGISDELAERIGSPPAGHGLLGVTLRDGERLRVPHVGRDPRAVGFPPHHPRIDSLLAVPIVCRSPFRGNLYVGNKRAPGEFTKDDEDILSRFAAQAAIAIENAHLHRRLRSLAVAEERARIAREMHDGMAQVLAYVNTKAQAVRELLKRKRTEAAEAQLEELANAARSVYTDVREGILALRASADAESSLPEALAGFLRRWQEQTGISVEAELPSKLHLRDGVELQLLRIIQEALTNVRKHSGSRRARVEVCKNAHAVVARVRDDGNGFDLTARGERDRPRFGLSIMRERAESVGGRVAVDTSPGRGTTVTIEIPTG